MFNIFLVIVQLIFIVITTICIKFSMQYFYKRFRFRKIPGMTGIPFLGVAWDLIQIPVEDQQAWFSKVAAKFKGDVYILWIGPHPFVNIQKPRQMEVLLPSTVNIKKSFVYDLFTPWLGNGLLTSTGEKWFHQRRLLTPAFHLSVLEKFTEVMINKANVLNECLEKYLCNNPDKPVEIFDFVSMYALDIICETAMGIDIDAQRKPASSYVKAVHEFSDLVSDRYIRPWYMWDFLYFKTRDGQRYKKTVQIMHDFTLRVIEEKLERRKHVLPAENEKIKDDFGKKKRKAFLDILLEASENDAHPLSINEIREQVDTFMFAGHDTTATTMCWTLFTLGNELEIQGKVREELHNVFSRDINSSITGTQLMQLKYLDRVIKETLRLYPSVPFIFRDLSEDVTFDGHKIPAETSLIINILDQHRDAEIWENPLDFNPDRFLPENIVDRHPYVYIPFSAGPRNCIGQKFAFLELKVALASLLRKWQVKSIKSSKEIKLKTDILLRCSESIKLILTPIDT